tara:strand:- start:2223 stop:2549 length:327 start_codon:yes stop_codon:yes gene_type:complete
MKLKKLLSESKVWERKFGEPLPTLEDTTKRFKLKTEEELNENDLNKVSSILGKSSSDVNSFLKKHKLDADDLLDVIETGGRRYSLAIIAAMKGNRRALKQLDDLLGFL